MEPESDARDGVNRLPARPDRPLDITVLLGGSSSEREVSLMSGTAVAEALESVGHKVTRADITASDVSALDRQGIDVVFIALHGAFGESGEVQTLCEQRHLRYIGSGPRASKMAMDKAASKQIFKTAGLQTPGWMIAEEFHQPQMVRKWLEGFPPPVVVKPVDGGSSVDITMARDVHQRDEAVEDLYDTYGRAMIEQFVPGREMTVGVLGEDVALPVLEVLPDGDFYDYRAKYDDDAATGYSFDLDLGENVTRHLQEAAVTAHQALGCRDLSRVDFILDHNNIGHVLEVNTIPGFTSHSLLPKAAQRAGMDFPELVDRIVAMAMSRDPRDVR